MPEIQKQLPSGKKIKQMPLVLQPILSPEKIKKDKTPKKGKIKTVNEPAQIEASPKDTKITMKVL